MPIAYFLHTEKTIGKCLPVAAAGQCSHLWYQDSLSYLRYAVGTAALTTGAST